VDTIISVVFLLLVFIPGIMPDTIRLAFIRIMREVVVPELSASALDGVSSQSFPVIPSLYQSVILKPRLRTWTIHRWHRLVP
jgi:hypothetical protein